MQRDSPLLGMGGMLSTGGVDDQVSKTVFTIPRLNMQLTIAVGLRQLLLFPELCFKASLIEPIVK